MHTWGISGPWFLVIYVVLFGLAGLAALFGRRPRARPAPEHPVDPAELDPYEVAMLNGGERLAVTAAVANLKQAGAIGAGQTSRMIVADGRLPLDAHPVEQAVYATVDRLTVQSLRVNQDTVASTPALTGLQDRGPTGPAF
jgi:uncharacterized protein (TIGR04222 family)